MTVYVKTPFETVEDGIANMLVAAIDDYNEFMPDNEKMKEEFAEGFVVKKGSKYVKIMTRNGGSAWGFVVATDNDKKFKKGDLLMCAGWAAPARNAARGNVLDGGFAINWTGPLYLT